MQTPHGPSNRFLIKTELNAEANMSRCFWKAKIELFAYQINNRLYCFELGINVNSIVQEMKTK